MLAILLQNQIQASVFPPSAPSPLSGATPSIEEAMAFLIQAYKAEAVEERSTKIRKIAQTFPGKDQHVLEEFGRHLLSSFASSSGNPHRVSYSIGLSFSPSSLLPDELIYFQPVAVALWGPR
jgi:hypothetical protein